MSNENSRTTSTNASLSTSFTANINATSTTSPLASISPLSSRTSSLPVSSFVASTSHFDATVNAIAAVVNASTHLPVTPPDAAVVVAVAVSSLAAAIIPDTPIVSIAGLTLSEITTTTTSTRTTPTPVPTTNETNSNKNVTKKDDLSSRPSDSLETLKPSASASVKQPHRQMSVANTSVEGATTNATCPASNVAADNDTQANSFTSNVSSTTTKNTDSSSVTSSPTTEVASPIQSLANATVSTTKTEANSITPTENKSKDILSDSWEERRLNDWDDNELKELLDEAYSYKNPRDKENKSKIFLQLLEKVQNDEQSYAFRARGSRNLSSSITSNSYHHYQNPHYHSHSHNHNRSHHHHKQGGSLQDLFEIGLHETQLDCDQSFGTGIGGNQRTRRQNHNSRQKKYSSSVSSRQREGGSLPSNVNVTHQISGSNNELGFMQQEGLTSNSASSNKVSKKEHRRNAAKFSSGVTSSPLDNKDNSSLNAAVETPPSQVPVDNVSPTFNVTKSVAVGDFIIDMGEIIDIQQQQKILQSKGQDSTKQGQSYYERLVSIDKRIPRVNLIGSTKSSYFAPTTSHCYVDETVRFNTLERNDVTAANNNSNASTAVDAKFLPLDENYKACKSVLGGDDDKSPELTAKQKSNSIYTKIKTPASGSPSLGGASNNIATLNQRQLDENGNALSEIYQNSSAVGGARTGTSIMQINCGSPTRASTGIPASAGILLTSCGGNNVSTSATVTIPPHPTSNTVSTSATITTYAAGPSQAKAKSKKKSQQERNTKTVDVESVAGYRGKDPVEELVKYIESSGEGGGSNKSGDKKKDRKKDKEKHQKLKKSNSLEELRSGAKMEVHELKRTAATTESNAVILRQKAGSGGGKQGKNNSSSTADINKNLESKSTTNASSRKCDRRSWGNEDLKYLGDQQNANFSSVNEDKTVAGTTTTINVSATNSAKERKNPKGGAATAAREEKEIKDRTAERNERNLTNNSVSCNHLGQQQLQNDKLEKQEKIEKPERTERRKRYDTPPNAVTIIDIVPMESSCPETAEFHVVTKKKKPKKPKVISNSEETTVTFSRTHNFTIQKTTTQSIPRYKYHQHEANNSTVNQQHQQQQNNCISVMGGSIAQNSYTSSSSSSQHQYQQNAESYNNTDKSRRKSTSSVPPSEKSDSSDLDSVHSLPIESTKVNLTKDNSQQKLRGPKTGNPSSVSNKNISHAPISYADIARTNKEIADAAAAFSLTEATQFEAKNLEGNVVDEKPPVEDKLTANTTVGIKTQKLKKSQIKQDFPELVGPISIAPVTYSQSLSTTTNTGQNAIGSPPSDVLLTSSQTDVITKVSLPSEQNNSSPNSQTLQKSKSVENDSTTTIANLSYIAPLNSNNLDQQYPALEKTVKRHSSANISANYMTANQQTTTFNFAAAAKQQISTNNTEPTNLNCNKNLALTTSTNANTQVAAPAANNATIASITTSNANINTNTNTNKKPKEKSPPINSQSATQDAMNSKKSKKERQQLQHNFDSSNASQLKSSSSFAPKKPYRSQLKSSSSLPHTSTQTNPRPAVIILNDDRNSSRCAADNQFTFGDFNEDELKLFEDDVSSTNNHTGEESEHDMEHQAASEYQKEPCERGTIKSPVSTYFNDSGASCENDMVDNTASDMLLNSSIDASSPNTSFTNTVQTSRGGSSNSGHMAAAGNNQSSDSGIYTDKVKSTTCSQQTTSRQNKLTSPTKDDNKLNTFLSNTKCASVHTSMDSLDPPPQQLETCNDIETAIIAAARAAAKNQQKHNQQQQFKNSNSSSNSSSFSSSSYSSTTAAPYQHSSNSKISNQHVISCGGSNNISSYHVPNQQQQQETQLYDVDDNDESFDNTTRSRSPSRPRRISIQFIPPTMATALTTQQHNEIIVDFIGSAWEEIANSKVTKVYDGQ